MAQFGANLVVGRRPGEAFEDLGRARSGCEDAGYDAVVQITADLNDLGSSGGGAT